MKRSFLIALVFFGFSFATYAQPGKGDVELGVDVGYNFSMVFNTIGIGQPTDGVNLAGSFDYYFSDRWSLKTKVIYDQKGWDGEVYLGPFFFFPSNYSQVYNLNYITIPVMANFHFGKKRNWYVDFGPYVGFLLDAENTTTGNSIKNSLSTVDIGISYGIGVKIPLNNNLKIFFEIDEQGGFKNIFNNYNNEYDYNDEYGINVRGSFNVGLIYQFNKIQSE